MSYRPLADMWLLARPKVPYYGSYPSGFLERARALLGVQRDDVVLHVCGGRAKDYPAWARLCPRDQTLDLDRRLRPDFVQDARDPLPRPPTGEGWAAVLADPPYTDEDAAHYRPDVATRPSARVCLLNGLAAVRPGGRVGIIHYLLPRPPRRGVKFLACVGVIVGYDNRLRCYSVFERLPDYRP